MKVYVEYRKANTFSFIIPINRESINTSLNNFINYDFPISNISSYFASERICMYIHLPEIDVKVLFGGVERL